MPPQSCEFNSAETVFALSKKNQRKLMALEVPNSQEHFERLVLKSFQIIDQQTLKKLTKANFKCIKNYLDLNLQQQHN